MYYCMNFAESLVNYDGCLINIKIDNYYGYQIIFYNDKAIYYRYLIGGVFKDWYKIL